MLSHTPKGKRVSTPATKVWNSKKHKWELMAQYYIKSGQSIWYEALPDITSYYKNL